jgi:hypothetical protein
MSDDDASAMPLISGTITAQLGLDSPLVFQLSELCEKLQVALCEDVPPRTRKRYVAAIVLIADFFKEIGFPLPIFVELLEFARALQELDRGTVRDSLKPLTAFNHPTDPSDVWQARAQVAIAVEQMIVGGLSRREASRRIAKWFPELKALTGSKSKDFASAVGDWHIRLSQGEVKDDVATAAWRDREQLVIHYQTIMARAGTASPGPLQIAFLTIRGLLPLGGLARSRSERESDRSQSTLRETRVEREFTRPPDPPRR